MRSLPTVSHTIPGADLAAVAAALDLPASAATNVVTRAQETARATLRIQDGCDEHCTFCATTIARGSARSRPVERLVAEASELAERHAEIVLTGIHIGSWGVDLGRPLSLLVDCLVRQVPRVRFRLSSLEATEVDDRLRELLRSDDGRLAPHLHAPLQSGSNHVLRRMGRHWYTAETYAAAINALVRDRGVFGLGADVICGFPGETDADHQATMSLVEQTAFTYLHVFPFSARPGTAATRLGAVVPAPVIERRAAELRALAQGKAAAYRLRREGGMADIVVVRGGPRCEGITEDFLTVQMRRPVPRGTRLRARLTNDGNSLLGTPEAVESVSSGYLSRS